MVQPASKRFVTEARGQLLYAPLGSVGGRLRHAAAAARRNNGIELGVIATAPVVTASTSNPDATLTKFYSPSAGQLSSFRFSGCVPTVGVGPYSSFYLAPTITQPSGSGGNTPNLATKNTLTWAFEFMTDAPKMNIRVLTTPTAQIEVDDQPIATNAVTVGGGGGDVYVNLDFTNAGGSKTRKIRVEQMLASGIMGVQVGPTYSVWAPNSETNIRVVSIGDSIAGGTGLDSTAPGGSWEKVAAKLLGWVEARQIAIGGTGFTNAGSGGNTFGAALRIADAVSANPDLVIISASQNDDAASAAAITAAALAAFQAYRTALPSAPIVVQGVDASSSGPSAARLANDTAVKAAFDAWADSNSFWLPNASDPSGSWQTGTGLTSATTGTGNRDRFGADAAHPNVLGHRYLGQRFANAFRSTVLGKIR